jgi:hypothetical protein
MTVFMLFGRSRGALTVLSDFNRAAYSRTCTSIRSTSKESTSVTGLVYQPDTDALDSSPVVTLFTKMGCTLCDQVKNILASVREDHPHTLMAIDITDPQHSQWFNMYKYDIPVLHINQLYWAKHRLTREDAIAGLRHIQDGTFTSPSGQPNAAAKERKTHTSFDSTS